MLTVLAVVAVFLLLVGGVTLAVVIGGSRKATPLPRSYTPDEAAERGRWAG